MREILTILAGLLVTALTVALVGPFFVDWSAHRDLIEAQMTRALGAPVTTQGAISLRLLPSPVLTVENVGTRDAGGVIDVRGAGLRLELAVAPLLRGDLEFVDATLTKPEIRLRLTDGALALPAPAHAGSDLQIKGLRVAQGRLTLERASAPVVLDDVTLDAEVDSLSGPFRGTGSVRRGDATIPFRFSTAARDGERMRAKIVIDAAAGLPKLDLDGALTFAPTGMGQTLAYLGTATLSAVGPLPWRATGPLKLDAREATLEPLDLRVGGDEGAVTLSGSLKARFAGDPEVEVALNARQLDLDRLGRRRDGQGTDMIRLLRQAIADPTLSQRIPLAMRLALETPTMLVNGDTLTDVMAEARLRPSEPLGLRLAVIGPGRSAVKLDGVLETGAAARFQGKTDTDVGDTQRLAEWIGDSAADLSAVLRGIPFRNVGVAGDMTLSAAGFSGQHLALKLDRSRLAGAATLTRAVGPDRGRLFADLTSDALDLDGLPDLSGPGAALRDMDLALSLDARAVRVARFGDGMIDAGRIRARLTKTGARTKLEDLSVLDLGGASLQVSGDADATRARLAGRLTAQRLTELADLARRVVPGPWSEMLAARAVALSPAQLSVGLDAGRPSADDPFAIASMTLDGTARGTAIAGTLRPGAQNGSATTLSLESKDASQLVRQLGLDTLAVGASGPGKIAVVARADSDSFAVTSDATLAGVQIGFRGRASGSPLDPRARGDLTVRAADAAPFLRMMTLSLPDITAALPVDAAAQVDFASGRLSAKALRATLSGATMTGNIEAGPDAALAGRLKIGGALQVSRASLPGLATLLLGTPQAVRTGSRWSDVRFAAGAAGLPLAQLAMQVNSLDLMDGVTASDARFVLTYGSGLLSFDGLHSKLGEAPLDGRLVLRRDGPVVSLSAAATIAAYALDRPGVSGSFGGHFDVTATGQSMQSLIAGLAGEGRVTADGLTIPRADPDAPVRVLAQSDAGSIFVSENDFVGALRRELDKAPFRVGATAFDVTLAAGVLRLKPSNGVALSYDARTGESEARATLGLRTLPKDWDGPAPQLDVIWKGALAAPIRTIEAGSFVNALAARAIAREAGRVEALEADIRERAAFVRRQKGLEFLHRRQREVAGFEAEQARLAAEAERRRVEDEARARADEDRRRAIEAAQAERARQEQDRRARQATPPIESRPLPESVPAPVAPIGIPPPSGLDRPSNVGTDPATTY